MVQNQILRVSVKEVKEIIQELKISANLHIVELQGKGIQSWEDYITEVEKAFEFPTTCIDSPDRYLDWIRDLDWLNKEGYVLVIYDYNIFLENEPALKKDMIRLFTDIILPWWQEDVEKCVVEGKAKPFNVYLVD